MKRKMKKTMNDKAHYKFKNDPGNITRQSVGVVR